MSGPSPATQQRTVDTKPRDVDTALGFVRTHVLALIAAINRKRYELAWLESLEVTRSLALLDHFADKMTAVERTQTAHLFAVVRNVARRALARAPAPSRKALVEGRPANRSTPRPTWDAEEEAWIAQCAQLGPLFVDSLFEIPFLTDENNTASSRAVSDLSAGDTDVSQG